MLPARRSLPSTLFLRDIVSVFFNLNNKAFSQRPVGGEASPAGAGGAPGGGGETCGRGSAMRRSSASRKPTVFAFSTENSARSTGEVQGLMALDRPLHREGGAQPARERGVDVLHRPAPRAGACPGPRADGVGRARPSWLCRWRNGCAVVREAARRCGESQGRTHVIATLGVEQLSRWASEEAYGTGPDLVGVR